MHNYKIDNFIGVFHNAVSKEFCDKMITHYENRASYGFSFNRQTLENVPKNSKDNHVYPLELDIDPIAITSNHVFIKDFATAVWECHKIYSEKYGALNSLATYAFSESIKIQKTNPSEGYHIWHCEHGSIATGRRLMLVMLYLNDIEEGGETEFLYQSVRIKPTVGTILLCPGSWTHTHRGNPPLTGSKYVMNTWMEFSV